jgi:hypothetical protein
MDPWVSLKAADSDQPLPPPPHSDGPCVAHTIAVMMSYFNPPGNCSLAC